MKTAKFELYKSHGAWRWRLRAANGEIVASGEGHTTKRRAVRAIYNLSKWASEAANAGGFEKP